MSIQEQLVEDQKSAMRAKDKATLNAIRSVQSEVATAKSAPGFTGEVDEDFYRTTIVSYAKRLRKSKDEYDGMGERGAEHSAKIAFELEYLEQFLPAQLDEDATRDTRYDVRRRMAAAPSAPGRNRTCAPGSGGRCSIP